MWFVRLLLLGSLLCAVHSNQAHATTEKFCRELYRQKRFLRASQCFESLARNKKPPLSMVQKYEVGLWLANAARNLSKAAERDKDPTKAAYYREKAANLCKEYLRRKLEDTPSSKKRIEGFLLQLNARIGYAGLTVSSGHPKAIIEVTGFQYKAQARENFTKQLRPGRYALKVTYPNARVLKQMVSLQPKKLKLVRLTMPQIRPKVRLRQVKRPPAPLPRQKPPIWPPITMGIGIAIAAGGIASLGIGLGITQTERDQLAADQSKLQDPTTTQRIKELDDATRMQVNLGYTLAGVGGGIALLGAILWATLGRHRDKVPTTAAHIVHHQPALTQMEPLPTRHQNRR